MLIDPTSIVACDQDVSAIPFRRSRSDLRGHLSHLRFLPLQLYIFSDLGKGLFGWSPFLDFPRFRDVIRTLCLALLASILNPPVSSSPHLPSPPPQFSLYPPPLVPSIPSVTLRGFCVLAYAPVLTHYDSNGRPDTRHNAVSHDFLADGSARCHILPMGKMSCQFNRELVPRSSATGHPFLPGFFEVSTRPPVLPSPSPFFSSVPTALFFLPFAGKLCSPAFQEFFRPVTRLHPPSPCPPKPPPPVLRPRLNSITYPTPKYLPFPPLCETTRSFTPSGFRLPFFLIFFFFYRFRCGLESTMKGPRQKRLFYPPSTFG